MLEPEMNALIESPEFKRLLNALIESPELRRFQEELHSPRFSPFDVLQVTDVEIRHSNVLAWLLTPDGTHGIGGRFLREFVDHLTRRHDAAPLRRLSGFDDKDNVEIRREDYHDGGYADITVGFKAERVLLIIENKVVGWYPEAEDQTKGYQGTLRQKYKGRYKDYPGVLLTTSNLPEGGSAERGTMVHPDDPLFRLSWGEVREIIRSLLKDGESGNFADGQVRDFVKRYVEVIEDRLIHTGDDPAERLYDEHPQIFEKLQEEPALLDEVDEPHRTTIRRWMGNFEGRPRRLREKVAEYLTQKGWIDAGHIKNTGVRDDLPGWRWLVWFHMPSGEELGIPEGCGWRFTFEPRSVTVTVQFGTLWEPNPKNPAWQRIWSFLQHTPIDRDRSARYPMEKGVIYRHNLLKDAELARPFEETVELLHRGLDQFFGPDGDYGRIERYLKCLAFNPREPRPLADGETAS